MNRIGLFCLLCAISITMVWLVQGSFAWSDDEIKKENNSYIVDKYDVLKQKSIYKKSYDGTDSRALVFLHIVKEEFDENASANQKLEHVKAMYFPSVDYFSELRSTYTQNLLNLTNVKVRVWLEIPAQKLRSESRIILYRYQKDEKFIYDNLVGSRAITIEMEEGIIKRLYWDDGCTACPETKCLESGCSSLITSDISPACHDPHSLKEDPYRCGIKIYVAWKGTDQDNHTLESYGSLPSRFQKYSFIASAYDAAAGFTSDFIKFWKKPLN